MSYLKSNEKRKIRTTLQVKENNKSKRNILVVFRSNKNISAQIIDLKGKVLATSTSSSNTMKEALKGKSGVEIASVVGADLAKKAVEKGLKEVVFNKGPYKYTGRVKALADAARENGLIF